MSYSLSMPIVHPKQPILHPEDYQILGSFLFHVSILLTGLIIRLSASETIEEETINIKYSTVYYLKFI